MDLRKGFIKRSLVLLIVFLLVVPGEVWAKKRIGANVIVVKNDGNTIKGELLKVKTQSIVIWAAKGYTSEIIGFDEIQRIKVLKTKSARRGKTKEIITAIFILGGGIVGGFVGYNLGYNIGYSMGDDDSRNFLAATAEDKGKFWGILFAITFGSGGIIGGAILGKISSGVIEKREKEPIRDSFEFEGLSQSERSLVIKKLDRYARYKK